MIYDHLKPGDKKVSGKPLFSAFSQAIVERDELKCNEKSHCIGDLESQLPRNDPTNCRPSDKGCDTSPGQCGSCICSSQYTGDWTVMLTLGTLSGCKAHISHP